MRSSTLFLFTFSCLLCLAASEYQVDHYWTGVGNLTCTGDADVVSSKIISDTQPCVPDDNCTHQGSFGMMTFCETSPPSFPLKNYRGEAFYSDEDCEVLDQSTQVHKESYNDENEYCFGESLADKFECDVDSTGLVVTDTQCDACDFSSETCTTS
eukprot:126539_1